MKKKIVVFIYNTGIWVELPRKKVGIRLQNLGAKDKPVLYKGGKKMP